MDYSVCQLWIVWYGEKVETGNVDAVGEVKVLRAKIRVIWMRAEKV